ncbi:sulfatase-like hydrolase/transferase [Actinomycetospora lemnae]|uniref:Sulfatase-like hydrolase/transferase n=1 Tax=Actinomycetospora lemnae TaxID=3019891 RepID=A0ABT5T2S7_9PSEU|nr:sulfatase-like hydrolase/transferase [Actinomycetospora sp. DW7H6]MDD7969324.1 sulfatase-like hydrolase/transferase [Actinomycetospora sp. DW7H6]
MGVPTGGRRVLPEPDVPRRAITTCGPDGAPRPFDPVRPTEPPAGAPNVVLVVLDDLGFGSSSAFGGPCRMPTADRLADDGLRYTRFHVTALCSPTRQALMTGRNHHAVGMGATTEMATSAPGYTGYRPRSAATLARVLQGNGYSTAAFGKWHQTPPAEISPVGPFDRWPTGEGFDHFYGFMACEMNHWYPLLYEGTTPVEPSRRPEDGYHLSEDLVDRAVDWVHTQRSLTPDRPFFTYLAFGASHAPLHVAPEWRERYDGAFDDGWDRLRETTLARQKALGVVPEATELAPWPDGVPHWDELDDTRRALGARFMETFAGFTEHADAQLGRFVAALEELGAMENTLFLYLLGDNGASGEGGIEGTHVEHRLGHGMVDDPAEMLTHLDEIGGPASYPIAPVGWALAMNTPYQWTKQVASHFGGTRDGLVVHWPAGIADRGGLRHQFHHVIDVLPTVLECAGIPQPTSVDGTPQQPIDGTSMRYTFADADAPDRRRTQYFEMCGNRGVYHDGWTAVTRHGTPWEMVPTDSGGFRDDVWELYDTTTDPSQAHDVAGEHPELLARLRELFLVEAAKYQVFPLDDRVTERENPRLAGRLDLVGDRTSVTFRGSTRRLIEETVPNVKNRSHAVVADVEAPGDGVLVAQGGRFGGWALYVSGGRACYVYNFFGLRRHTVRADHVLAAGRHEVRVDFAYDGGGDGRGGTATLRVDGLVVGAVRVDATVPYYFSFDETFDVGVDLGTPVTDDYAAGDNAFTGTVHSVRVELTAPDPEPGPEPEGRHRRVMASH